MSEHRSAFRPAPDRARRPWPSASALTAAAERCRGARSRRRRRVAATRQGRAYKPKFFTAARMADRAGARGPHHPRDERSGSATDAGVPEFMDFFLTDPLEDDPLARAAARPRCAAGSPGSTRSAGGASARTSWSARRASARRLLDEIAHSKGDERTTRRCASGARSGPPPRPDFFNSFRDLTASGFWSSKIGIDDLGYMGNTFLTECPEPARRRPAQAGADRGPRLPRAVDRSAGRRRELGDPRPLAPRAQGGGSGDREHPGASGEAARGRARALRRQGPVPLEDARRTAAAAKWKVDSGYMEVARGPAASRPQGFGDCQLHVEWMAPAPPVGQDQDRGNSGVFFMGQYEVQVLDRYQNETYADGQAAAVYGQYPPLVNAYASPGPVADVRHRLPRARTSTPTEGHQARAADRPPQRRARPGPRRAERPHRAQGPPPVPAHPAQAPDLAPGPRPPGAVPEHLDPRARPLSAPPAHFQNRIRATSSTNRATMIASRASMRWESSSEWTIE